jgi:hypothetical protein
MPSWEICSIVTTSPDSTVKMGSASLFGWKPQEISSGLSEVTTYRVPSGT